jgi:hypothetical protein
MKTANAATLPALPRISTGNPALDRWVQAVTERLEVREGSRGNPNERAVTVRELRDLGFYGLGDGSSQAGNVLTVNADGTYSSMTPDAFSESIRKSKLYKDLMKRLDDVTRFDGLPEQVKAILLNDLAAEAAKRGADIQRLEHKIQSATESLAYTVEEVTASVQGSIAGVRETVFASATESNATAGVVTQLIANLDGTGSATAEQSLVVIADRTAGLSSQYMLKLNAGKAVTAVGLLASEDPMGLKESKFIVQADQFVLTGTYTYMQGDASSTPSETPPLATTAGDTWYNTRTNISYRAAGGTWNAYTQPIPFGVDMTTNTTFINGQLRVTGSGQTLDALASGSAGTSAGIAYAYKRSATDLIVGWSPTANGPGAITWTFASGSITTPATDALLNGWTKAIPAGTDPLYVTVSSAANTAATDDIAATEWAAPVLLVANGTNGTNGVDGLNVATAILYQRNASSTVGPTAQANTVTYTFGTGGMTGMSAGWTASIPSASGGAYLWVTRATASATTATDTLAVGEWSTPVLYTQDGIGGVNGRAVSLSTGAYSTVVPYDAAGNRISGGNSYVNVTATAFNCTGTPYYEFFLDGSSVQASGTSTSYTYNKQALFTSMPDVVRVDLRDGSPGGPVVGSDQISFIGVQQGGNGVSAVLSNDSHTLPTTTAGVVTYTGSGTTFQVYEGATALTFSANSASYPATAGQFNATVSGSSITAGGISGTGTSTGTVAQHSGMSATTATVTLTLYIRLSTGATLLLTKLQTLSQSLQGATGATGPTSTTPGPTGTRGTIVTKTTSSGTAANAAAAVMAVTSATGALPATPIKGDIVYYPGGALECTAAGNPGSWSGVAAYIDGSLVATGTIAASQLSATAIDGKTITGATLQTAASGARYIISSYSIAGYNASNTQTVNIDMSTATAQFLKSGFGPAVIGTNTGTETGVQGQSSGSGAGVYGNSATGTGVVGFSSSYGVGVSGSSTSGYGASFTGNTTRSPLALGSLASKPTTGTTGDICVMNPGVGYRLCLNIAGTWYYMTNMTAF